MKNLQLITPPAAMPIDVPTAKKQAVVSFADDDNLIDRYIAAATERLDGWTGILGRCLMPQTWQWSMDTFPAGSIVIPLGPVASITEITYDDAAGAPQTLDPAEYEVDIGNAVTRIRAVSGWPGTGDKMGAVRVRWVAGTGCPEPIKVAIMMMVAHMFEHRQGAAEEMPAVRSLIAPFRRVGM